MPLTNPMPVPGRRTWRLGSWLLQHDRTAHGGWQLDIGDRYRVVEFSRFHLQIQLLQFKDNQYFTLALFGAYIKLPWRTSREVKDDMIDGWGFSAVDALHLKWGSRHKVVWWPWGWQHIDSQHQALMTSGRWVTFPRAVFKAGEAYVSSDELLAAIGPRWERSYPYGYMRRSGEVQERTAVVKVERRAWRRRCLPEWLPLFQKRTTSIDITFSDEVGERSGSWKGGVLGCSWAMKPGETPGQALKRMEQNRRFN